MDVTHTITIETEGRKTAMILVVQDDERWTADNFRLASDASDIDRRLANAVMSAVDKAMTAKHVADARAAS